jgi:hypothetical protein
MMSKQTTNILLPLQEKCKQYSFQTLSYLLLLASGTFSYGVPLCCITYYLESPLGWLEPDTAGEIAITTVVANTWMINLAGGGTCTIGRISWEQYDYTMEKIFEYHDILQELFHNNPPPLLLILVVVNPPIELNDTNEVWIAIDSSKVVVLVYIDCQHLLSFSQNA